MICMKYKVKKIKISYFIFNVISLKSQFQIQIKLLMLFNEMVKPFKNIYKS